MQAFNTTLFLNVFLFYASEVRLHPNFNNIHGFDYYLIFSGKNVTAPPPSPPSPKVPPYAYDQGTKLARRAKLSCLINA